MKKILLLAASFLFPFVSVHAEESGGAKGFKTGTEFNLKVAKVQSTTQTGYFGEETKAKIPKGIPKFKKGSTVKFKIASNGKLTGDGFAINFAHASDKVVEYDTFVQEGNVNSGQNAEVYRRNQQAKRATKASMLFTITDFSSGEPVIQTVKYELQ